MVDEFKVSTKDGGIMYRRIIEANDSCLFNSLGLALRNSLQSAKEQREYVSKTVLKEPNFDEAILGKRPMEYSNWIL